MPEYTKEQIDEAKLWLTTNDTGDSYDQKRRIGFEAIVLSALDTAERERDALKARCAELEARLQGAADRAIAWYTKDAGPELIELYEAGVPGLRAAILGEKEDQVGKI